MVDRIKRCSDTNLRRDVGLLARRKNRLRMRLWLWACLCGFVWADMYKKITHFVWKENTHHENGSPFFFRIESVEFRFDVVRPTVAANGAAAAGGIAAGWGVGTHLDSSFNPWHLLPNWNAFFRGVQ